MFSRLLSQAVLGQVIAAAPSPREEVIDLGLRVYEQLCATTIRVGDTVAKRYLSDIAKAIGPDVTPKEVGAVIREMGLSSKREREGYMVIWNEKQMDILAEALGEGLKGVQ